MTAGFRYEVKRVGSSFLEKRWNELAGLLEAAFSSAEFLEPGSTADRPARDTYTRVHGPGAVELGHVVAFDGDGGIVGAQLCLPLDGRKDERRCEVGWFFTVNTLSDVQQEEIGDAVMHRTHDELVRSGYESVVTGMGTEAIAAFMSWRHRYLPAPLNKQRDRWIKSLRTGPASVNSVKKPWRDTGQSARYATADIRRDEIVIDLAMLLERSEPPTAQTVQLGDGRSYRSSEGPFGLNHSCSPNGYICFEDLTYRALHDVSEGSELTFNYCTTEYEMTEPFDCLCGSPDCLGRVSGFKGLSPSQVEKIRPYVSPAVLRKL